MCEFRSVLHWPKLVNIDLQEEKTSISCKCGVVVQHTGSFWTLSPQCRYVISLSLITDSRIVVVFVPSDTVIALTILSRITNIFLTNVSVSTRCRDFKTLEQAESVGAMQENEILVKVTERLGAFQDTAGELTHFFEHTDRQVTPFRIPPPLAPKAETSNSALFGVHSLQIPAGLIDWQHRFKMTTTTTPVAECVPSLIKRDVRARHDISALTCGRGSTGSSADKVTLWI